jgi:hypothetical protein
MAPPAWVAGVLAAVLLLIAGYCATRLVAASWWRRSTDHGVDVMHAAMGVAMAGMLVPRLNLLQARAWAALFAAGAGWFGWQVLRGRRRSGVTRPGAGLPAPHGHHGAHVLSCTAMVCMLIAAPHLGAPMTARAGATPVVALVLALAVAISVVVSTDQASARRPAAPAPLARRPLPPGTVPRAQAAGAGAAPAPGGSVEDHATGGSAPQHATQGQDSPRPELCPRLAASCQIMMGVAMAYMLILML